MSTITGTCSESEAQQLFAQHMKELSRLRANEDAANNGLRPVPEEGREDQSRIQSGSSGGQEGFEQDPGESGVRSRQRLNLIESLKGLNIDTYA